MAEPYGETVVLRSRAMQGIGVAMVVVAVVGVVSALTGSSATLLRVGAPVLLFGLLGWAAFWQPRVEVSAGGVTIVNTFRTIEIPWPAVEEVVGRYGLQLRTAYGTVTAWGASAPTGLDRGRARPSAAAAAVEERLAQLRAAGWLEDPRLERPTAHTRWHVPVIAGAVVLVVASVTLPALA